MALTPKQEAFCLAFLETGNASEAYRRSYDARRMKPETINRAAKELTDHPKISARIKELRKSVVDAAFVSYENHVRRLHELGAEAQTRGQFAAAISAEVARGRVAGLYVERTELTGADGGPLEVNTGAREALRAKLLR